MKKDVVGLNIDKPILDVIHAELERFSDSIYKSVCPACKEGLLLVGRYPETMLLNEYDRCVLCGQRVRYLDIDTLRGKDGPSGLRAIVKVRNQNG